MSVLFVLLPLSLLFAAGFLLSFIWAVRSGQYEDTCTPSWRMLLDEPGAGNAGEPHGAGVGGVASSTRSSEKTGTGGGGVGADRGNRGE